MSVSFVAPTDRDSRSSIRYAEAELHISTVNGFTPSSSTLKAVFAGTQAALPNLTAGATYYGRIVPVDSRGNRGVASAQFTVTPAFVGPSVLLPAAGMQDMPPNGSFEVNTDPLKAPDTWTLFPGHVWGTNGILSTDALSGTNSVRSTAGYNFRLESQSVIAQEGCSYKTEVTFKLSQTIGSTGPRFLFNFYNAAGAWLGGNIYTIPTSTPAGVWTRASLTQLAPAGTRTASVVVQSYDSCPAHVFFDSVRFDRVDTKRFLMARTGPSVGVWSGLIRMRWPSVQLANNMTVTGPSTDFNVQIPETGIYRVSAHCFVYASALGFREIWLKGVVYRNGAAIYDPMFDRQIGDIKETMLEGTMLLHLDAGDILFFEAWSSAAVQIGNNANETMFSIEMIHSYQ